VQCVHIVGRLRKRQTNHVGRLCSHNKVPGNLVGHGAQIELCVGQVDVVVSGQLLAAFACLRDLDLGSRFAAPRHHATTPPKRLSSNQMRSPFRSAGSTSASVQAMVVSCARRPG